MKTIGNNAFANSGIERIVLPQSLADIGDMAFYKTNNLRSLTIPAGVRQLPNKLVGRCEKLDTLTIQTRDYAFRALEDINGASGPVNQVVDEYCSNLKTIRVYDKKLYTLLVEQQKAYEKAYELSKTNGNSGESLTWEEKTYTNTFFGSLTDSSDKMWDVRGIQIIYDVPKSVEAVEEAEQELIIIPPWEPTDPADIYRHSLLGSEEPIYEELNLHYPIRMINEIQGPQFFDAVVPLKGKTRLARTYNVFVNEELLYTMDLPAKIRLQIPEVLQADGRTFVMYGVTEDGQAYVCKDLDREPSTITFETKRFYAFALGYQD